MTWCEFKKAVEQAGVKDDTVLEYIDYDPSDGLKEEKEPYVFFSDDMLKHSFWVR